MKNEVNSAVLLTPTGRGAIATILVCGPEAAATVARFFTSASGRPLQDVPLHRIAFGTWSNGVGDGEELVLSRRAADRIEVHCHGGIAAAEKILSDLESQGCGRVSWEGHILQAGGDLLAAEAHVALASCRTERTAAILLDQYHGALRAALMNVRSLIEADSLDAARAELERLYDRCSLGLHLTNPWRVVLAGAPNVGKSSLINALLGYDRSIVFDQPGTTRDVLTASAVLQGWPVQLSDTAGLRETNDAIEGQGVARANSELAQADVVVLVFDATESDATPRAAFASFPLNALSNPRQKTICVLNKCDASTTSDQTAQAIQRFIAETPRLAPAALLKTSAKHRQGIDTLIDSIAQLLVPAPPAPGDAVPFLPRHEAAIAQMRRLLGGDAQPGGSLRAALLDVMDWLLGPQA